MTRPNRRDRRTRPKLDDASEENLAALRRQAEQLIRERSADIDAIVAAL